MTFSQTLSHAVDCPWFWVAITYFAVDLGEAVTKRGWW